MGSPTRRFWSLTIQRHDLATQANKYAWKHVAGSSDWNSPLMLAHTKPTLLSLGCWSASPRPDWLSGKLHPNSQNRRPSGGISTWHCVGTSIILLPFNVPGTVGLFVSWRDGFPKSKEAFRYGLASRGCNNGRLIIKVCRHSVVVAEASSMQGWNWKSLAKKANPTIPQRVGSETQAC